MTRADAGYTVLEAMVAFAILSVVLVSLYGAAGTSLRAVDRGTRLQVVALLAQSKLDELAVIRDVLPETSKGTFSNSDVSWRVDAQTIDPTNVTSLRLQNVHLILNWSDGFGSETFDLQTRHLGTIRR